MSMFLQFLNNRHCHAMHMIFLISIMCLSFASTVSAKVGDTFTHGDLSYLVLSESGKTGTVSVTATYPSIQGTLSIPQEVTNSSITYRVTSIQAYAFSNTGVEGKLSIPNTVTNIGEYAFYNCSKLTGDLIIPAGVKKIYLDTFSGCTGLNGKLIIPEGVTFIGRDAFYNCNGLTGPLTIPSSVKDIGDYAFYNCKGFTGDLTIPEGVYEICSYAFAGCTGLNGTLTIPTSVDIIRGHAFENCSGLQSVRIPNGMTAIESNAFDNCQGIKHITLPSSLTGINSGIVTIPAELTVPQKKSSLGDYNNQTVNSIFYLSEELPAFSAESGSFSSSTSKNLYLKPTALAKCKSSSDGSKWLAKFNVTDAVPVTFPTDRNFITMCRDFDVDFRHTNDNLPSGISPLKAYMVSDVDEESNAIVLQEITYVPSRLRSNEDGFKGYDEFVGVLLKGTPGQTYYYNIGEDDYTKGKDGQMTLEKALALSNASVPTTSATFVGANDPKYVTPEETIDGVTYTTYGLKNNEFLKYSQAGYVPYNHAYLRVPTSSTGSAKPRLSMIFKNADGTTSIEQINKDDSTFGKSTKEAMYNLQGMKVDGNYHGIIIVNGHKYMKK